MAVRVWNNHLIRNIEFGANEHGRVPVGIKIVAGDTLCRELKRAL